MNSKLRKKFAEVAVNVGVNLQKNQDAVVFISAKNYKLAEDIVKECYKRGARKVSVEFHSEEITKLKYQKEKTATLQEVEDWEVEKIKRRSETLPALIYVMDDDPDAFNKINTTKIFKARIARYSKIKKYRDKESLYNQWTIIAVPSKKWAKKVFPDLPSNIAERKLLDAIVDSTRLNGEDPIKDWEKHIQELEHKAKLLNDLNLDYLIYKSSNGTNLTIKLQENHQWLSARSKSLNNIYYSANLPTEEVFTMPSKYGVSGEVVSTKPLSLEGKIIDNFKMYFEEGKIVKVEANKNQDVLEKAINTDEGSSYLGEVALVPYSSYINQSGILFYNTLFDENASCHLAFGAAYKETLKNYGELTEEDFKKINYNSSMMHVDFMIGAADLSIIGVDFNKKEHVIFVNGDWNI